MRRLVLPLAAIALLLTGCAHAPGSAPAPTHTETTSAPTPPPEPETTPDEPQSPEEDFTEAQLIDLCIAESTRYHNDPAVELYADQARVYPRPIDPPWLVYVPGHNSLVPEIASLCIIYGTPTEPEFAVALATMPMSEEEIQEAVNSNEPHDLDYLISD